MLQERSSRKSMTSVSTLERQDAKRVKSRGADPMRNRQPIAWQNGAPEELARKLDRLATHQLVNAALIAGVVLTLLLLTFGCSHQEAPELLTCQRELEGTKWELQRAEQKLIEQGAELRVSEGVYAACIKEVTSFRDGESRSLGRAEDRYKFKIEACQKESKEHKLQATSASHAYEEAVSKLHECQERLAQ